MPTECEPLLVVGERIAKNRSLYGVNKESEHRLTTGGDGAIHLDQTLRSASPLSNTKGRKSRSLIATETKSLLIRASTPLSQQQIEAGKNRTY